MSLNQESGENVTPNELEAGENNVNLRFFFYCSENQISLKIACGCGFLFFVCLFVVVVLVFQC